jgi:hypothetical protein
MNEEQTAGAISREVLARQREWVLAPLTVRIDKNEDVPSAGDGKCRLRERGTVRLLVAPRVYEAAKHVLTDRGSCRNVWAATIRSATPFSPPW